MKCDTRKLSEENATLLIKGLLRTGGDDLSGALGKMEGENGRLYSGDI